MKGAPTLVYALANYQLLRSHAARHGNLMNLALHPFNPTST